MADSDMSHVDQKMYKLAAMLDTLIRFHVDNIELDEMEQNYLNVWLKKERDPLLVTVIATKLGLRDPQAGEIQDGSSDDAAA